MATNGQTTRAAQARTDDALHAATWAAFATSTTADIVSAESAWKRDPPPVLRGLIDAEVADEGDGG